MDSDSGTLWNRTAGAVQSWLAEMELRLKQQESTTMRKRRAVLDLEQRVQRGEAPKEQLQVGLSLVAVAPISSKHCPASHLMEVTWLRSKNNCA